MIYELWETVCFSEGESPTPFILVERGSNLGTLYEKFNNNKNKYVITDNQGNTLVDNKEKF